MTKRTNARPAATESREGKVTPENIRAALAKLDPKDDSCWTDDGLPLIEVVAKLVGCPDSALLRNNITDAAPSFTRTTAAEALEDDSFLDGDAKDDAGRGSEEEKAAQLDADLAEAQAEKDEAQAAHDAARTMLDAAKRRVDECIIAKEKSGHGKVHPMVAVQAHIASQQAQRAARVEEFGLAARRARR